MRHHSTLSDLSRLHSFELKTVQQDIAELKSVLGSYSQEVKKFQESQSDHIDRLERRLDNTDFRAKPGNTNINDLRTPFEFLDKGEDLPNMNSSGVFLGTQLAKYSKQVEFLVEPYTGESNVHLLNWFTKFSLIIMPYFPSLSVPEVCTLLCWYLPVSIRNYCLAIVNSESPPSLCDFYSFLQNLYSDELDLQLDSNILVLKTFFSADFYSSNFLEILSSIENVARSLPLQQSSQKFRLILNKLSAYIPSTLHYFINKEVCDI